MSILLLGQAYELHIHTKYESEYLVSDVPNTYSNGFSECGSELEMNSLSELQMLYTRLYEDVSNLILIQSCFFLIFVFVFVFVLDTVKISFHIFLQQKI